MTPTEADERPHPAGSDAAWEESWWFDFVAADGSLAGFVRLGLWPNRPGAWYWAALVGDERPYLLVRDDDVPLPRAGRTEIRAEALWSALECETPLDHWSVGLEAFAVVLDDPADAWAGERGERAGLGFDLEWEATAPPDAEGPVSYRQPCRVSGDVLVGAGRIELDGHGDRAHRWGPADLPAAAPPRAASGATAPPMMTAPLQAGGRRFRFDVARPADGGPPRWWTAATS